MKDPNIEWMALSTMIIQIGGAMQKFKETDKSELIGCLNVMIKRML